MIDRWWGPWRCAWIRRLGVEWSVPDFGRLVGWHGRSRRSTGDKRVRATELPVHGPSVHEPRDAPGAAKTSCVPISAIGDTPSDYLIPPSLPSRRPPVNRGHLLLVRVGSEPPRGDLPFPCQIAWKASRPKAKEVLLPSPHMPAKGGDQGEPTTGPGPPRSRVVGRGRSRIRDAPEAAGPRRVLLLARGGAVLAPWTFEVVVAAARCAGVRTRSRSRRSTQASTCTRA